MKRLALRVAAIGVVAGGVWLAVRGIAPAELLRALYTADLGFVAALALPFLALGSLIRTARYAALLPASTGRARFGELWRAVVLSSAANNVLPLRAGELVRTRETLALGVPLKNTVFAQVTEKLVEAVTLVVCSIPVLVVYASAGHPALLILGAAVLVAALVTYAVRTHRAELVRVVAHATAWSFACDAVELAIVAVCLHSLGLRCDLVTSIAVYAAVNLAISLPSTPGNVGAFEVGAALPLIALGVSRDAAVAFALVYRVVQWVPVNVVGLALWARPSRLAVAGETP